MLIGDRTVGADARPYVIAEMSGNHNQSLDRALASSTPPPTPAPTRSSCRPTPPDTMTLDMQCAGLRDRRPQEPVGRPPAVRPVPRGAHALGLAPHRSCARRRARACTASARRSTTRRSTSSRSLQVPAYKIASVRVHRPAADPQGGGHRQADDRLHRHGQLAEIDETVRTARAAGCRDLVLLKCTSTYPASAENTHLRTIPVLRAAFGCEVGLSDHTMGCGAAVAAVALGAVHREALHAESRADGGVDSAFSLEPAEFAQLRIETERAWQALGGVASAAAWPRQQSMALPPFAVHRRGPEGRRPC
jgi:hypothetical protein